jgi:hypothetical protein
MKLHQHCLEYITVKPKTKSPGREVGLLLKEMQFLVQSALRVPCRDEEWDLKDSLKMSFIKQVFPGRGKHTGSFSLEAASEVNNGAIMRSGLTRDTRGLDKLAGWKRPAADALLQRLQELEEIQRQQAAQLHHHTEYIQALERRIQELEGDPATATMGKRILVERVPPQQLDCIQDEDLRPTIPMPLLTKLPPGAPTMPVPVPPGLSSETPTVPLLLFEFGQNDQDQSDDKRHDKRRHGNV